MITPLVPTDLKVGTVRPNKGGGVPLTRLCAAMSSHPIFVLAAAHTEDTTDSEAQQRSIDVGCVDSTQAF